MSNKKEAELTSDVVVAPTELQPLLKSCMEAGLVSFVRGSPGIGKSSIIHALCDEMNLQLIDMRLAQCDPTDLNGYPQPVEYHESQRLDWVPPKDIPLSTDPLPEGKDGWLLFFDEANSAPPSVQAAAYKIVLDRKVGQRHIHEKCMMVMAGNLDSDRAVTQRMSTALKSRLVHFTLEVPPKEFIQFAERQDFDARIVAYLHACPEHVHNFDPNVAEHTFACPRTWEFVDKYLKTLARSEATTPGSTNPIPDLPVLAGALGAGVGTQFRAVCELLEKCPTMEEIAAAPKQVRVPDEASMQYSLAINIGRSATLDNYQPLFIYITRLPVEFQVLTMMRIRDKNPEIAGTAEFRDWAVASKGALFGSK